MSSIFISYRREDAEGHAGRLFEDLTSIFGRNSVFMDVTGIDPGLDFRKVIESKVSSCSVLLAVIGKSWLSAEDQDGRRRIDNPNDFVRLETIAALGQEVLVIPVLVHGADMPQSHQLPAEIEELAFRNGIELTHSRWESDIQLLIQALERRVENSEKRAERPFKVKPGGVALLAASVLFAVLVWAFADKNMSEGVKKFDEPPDTEFSLLADSMHFPLPRSMTDFLTENDLQGKSDWELDLLRNEIFARYGRSFNRPELQNHFQKQDWYEVKYTATDFPVVLLTEVQKRNVQFVLDYQNSLK